MGERYDEIRELAEFAEFRSAPDDDPVVVIAGCGSGASVRELREYDVKAYGFDTSQQAVTAADDSVREYLMRADLRDDTLVSTLCERFVIDRIDVFLTECMLSFLSVEEATDALSRLRAAPEIGTMLHKVRLDPPIGAQEGEIEATVMPPEEWKAACDPADEDVWRDSIERWELPPSET